MNLFNLFKKKSELEEHKYPTVMFGSFITGVPIQVTTGGGLTEAGSQDIYFCEQLLTQLKKKKSVTIQGFGNKRKITKEEVISHLNKYPEHLVKYLIESEI